MASRWFVLFVAALAPACTVIEVQGERPSTSYHFGVLKIEPAPGTGAISYRSRGFGIVPGLNGVTIGYRSDDAVLVADPHACRIVIFDLPEGVTAEQAGNQAQLFCPRGE